MELLINNKDYNALNAMLNLYDADGNIQFEKDKEAAREFFLQHVNQNTVFFTDLEEKFRYLIDNDYYEADLVEQYAFEDIKSLYKYAHSFKFRFPTFVGAYKFYQQYALKTFDGDRYLERYEDRVVMTALGLAQGNIGQAYQYVTEIIEGRFQPATPTFLNMGRKQRGELVSCFLLRTEDNMESIARAVNASLQLSKRGGGVALNLSNLRETGAPIKKIEGQSSGVVPVMKMLEDSFSYANQLGSRQGAGAVYLSAHHPDIMKFLDTKRENADEKIRIKTLSLGVVVPDITFELAKRNEDMYLFSPYDVERTYGVPFGDISVTEKYEEMVANPEIRKTKVSARTFFTTVAELQFESGYPYVMFEDTVNRANPVAGRINMSNLCSEILQVNTPSTYHENLNYNTVGTDISCNLGSMNIAKVMDGGMLADSVEIAIRALTSVAEQSNIESVPSIAKANAEGRAIGLGQMNLHGFLARERIHYDSPDAIAFTDAYFRTVLYHALRASNLLAQERGEAFAGFENSDYASGKYFDQFIDEDWDFGTFEVAALFADYGLVSEVPDKGAWIELREEVMAYGLYNQNLQAVPPTGSISYINNATASIHPITSKVEIRKEGKMGRVYYPAPYMTNDNLKYYTDAYEIGPAAIIDVYAAATRYVDQGLSLTLFFKDTATTRDINKAQIYAWGKGIKTIYYARIRQLALEGTAVDECVSCML